MIGVFEGGTTLKHWSICRSTSFWFRFNQSFLKCSWRHEIYKQQTREITRWHGIGLLMDIWLLTNKSVMVNTMEQFYLVTGHERPPLTNPLMLELTLKERSIFIHDSFFIPSLKKASFIVDSSRQTSECLFWIGCTNSVENNVLLSCRGVPSGDHNVSYYCYIVVKGLGE